MGNSAINSCVHVQVSGQRSVRVMQADGKMLHFAHPVLAIQLMQEHPGHLVFLFNASVPRSPALTSITNTWIARQPGYAPTSGNGIMQMLCAQKTISMVKADEELHPGRTYYLVPMQSGQEDGVRKTLFKSSKTSAKVASSFEYEDKSDGSRKENLLHKFRRSRSLPRFRAIPKQQQQPQDLNQPDSFPRSGHQSLRSLFMHMDTFPKGSGHQSLRTLFMEGSGQSCELSLQQAQNIILDTRRFMRPRRRRIRRLSQVIWKPILESIPEAEHEFSDNDDV